MLRTPLLVIALLLSGCIEMFQQETAGEHADQAPQVGFVDDEVDDRLVVAHVQSGISWAEFNMTADRRASFRLNDGPPREFNSIQPARVGTIAMNAGDKVDFCVSPASALQIWVIHAPTNTIVHGFAFTDVAAREWCN